MALTRAQLESILIHRCGRTLTAADLDGTTVDGSNADLSDPIASAIRACGGSVANVAEVVDSDLTAIADSDTDKLLDIAELRALESALGNYDLVDTKEGPLSQSLGQLATRLETKIARKRAALEKTYGIGVGTLSAGLINLGFQQQPYCGQQLQECDL